MMTTTTLTTLTTKERADVLISHAEKLSKAFNVPFKKYIHGKNKTELLRFITECENTHGRLPTAVDTVDGSEKMVVPGALSKITKKGAILEKVRNLPGFKKSWERKSCEELTALLSTSSKPAPAPAATVPVPVEVEESGTISPIRMAEYVDDEDEDEEQQEKKNNNSKRMDLKEAILRAFSDAPYDDTVYPRIQKKVLTF